jgi:Flp pilus assembly protein TadG
VSGALLGLLILVILAVTIIAGHIVDKWAEVRVAQSRMARSVMEGQPATKERKTPMIKDPAPCGICGHVHDGACGGDGG